MNIFFIIIEVSYFFQTNIISMVLKFSGKTFLSCILINIMYTYSTLRSQLSMRKMLQVD